MNEAQRKELEFARKWAAEQLASRKGTKRIAVDISLGELDGLSVTELVEWATGIRDQVPEEYRHKCKVEVEYGGDEYGGALEAHYDRPETEAERQADPHYRKLKSMVE